jgi:glycosyltransferase involved in cell wall biosynthesis
MSHNNGISIGMPIYNGEKFLEKKLKSIISQTYSNFELIISDNGSTDKTSSICLKYQKEDDRIKYFRHEKNRGITWNFNFVLKKSKKEFFIFSSVDDVISNNFLEKNFNVLQSNPKIAVSISKIETYNSINQLDKSSKNLTKKLKQKIRPTNTISINGTYENKVREYLKKSTCQVIYGLFRKNSIKEIKFESFIGNDWAVFLDILKTGDLYVIDEIMMYEYESGATGNGIINSQKHYNPKSIEKIFPWIPFTKWCWNNLDSIIFIKNLDYFIQLNIEGEISLIIDIIKKITNKFQGGN